MSTGVWTKNWRGIRNWMLTGYAKSGISTITNTIGNILSITNNNSGSTNYIVSPLHNLTTSNNPSNVNDAVLFGTGDTEPSESDYTLSASLGNTLSYSAVTNGDPVWNGATCTRTFSVTIQNRQDASVTIREYGLLASVAGSSVLLYRAVLDTPVTVGSMESATLTFSVSLTLSDPI